MTKDETAEADEVRAMLRRRAADVSPSPAAWEAITARIESGEDRFDAPVIPLRRTGDSGRDLGRRRLLAAAAAAAVVAVAVGSAALLGGDDAGTLVADGGTSTTVAPPPATATPGAGQLPGVWPTPTIEELLAHPDAATILAEPGPTASQYLSQRLPIGTGIVWEPEVLVADGSARVSWDIVGPTPGDGGTISLRRIGADGPWFVESAESDVLTVEPAVGGGDAGARAFSIGSSVAGDVEVTARRGGDPDPGGDVGPAVVGGPEVIDDGPSASGSLQAGGALSFGFGDGGGPVILRALLLGPDGDLLAFHEALYVAELPTEDAGTTTIPATGVEPTTTDAGDDGSPVEDGAAVGATTVLVTADGLGFVGAGDDTSASRLDFGDPFADVVEALTRSLGEPVTTGEDTECGAGPTDRAVFPNGLSVDGRDGALTSWALNEPSTLSDAAGIGIDSTVGELQEVYADATVEETTLGWELVGEPYGGIVSGPGAGDVVQVLWSGEPCIFR